MPNNSVVEIVVFAIVGLCVGSFLNVVIDRLPKVLQAQWAGQAASLSLTHPASHCLSCGHALAWFENIPLLSFIGLRGRCLTCGSRIGWRTPAVELLTALGFAACAYKWHSYARLQDLVSVTALVYAGFLSALLCLACIDWKTTYLPDGLTLPLMWAGLVCAAMGWLPGVSLHAALWGAVAGYLSLWLVYWAFKLLTGREGLGYGDFKLLAAIGAWLGWQALTNVVLIGSVGGLVLALSMRLWGRQREGNVIPFGPTLSLGAACSLLFGITL